MPINLGPPLGTWKTDRGELSTWVLAPGLYATRASVQTYASDARKELTDAAVSTRGKVERITFEKLLREAIAARRLQSA